MDYNTQTSKKWFSPKLIFVLLGVLLVVEVIWGVRSLISPSITNVAKKTEPMKAASASLTSTKADYKVGDTAYVLIKLDTGGHKTSGSDAIIHFDPKILEATGSTALIKGKTYTNYPKLDLDPKGLITISGVSLQPKDSFTGVGVLAEIKFKAKAVGQTVITLDYTVGSTTDSNVVDSITNKDILGSVSNLSLTIK